HLRLAAVVGQQAGRLFFGAYEVPAHELDQVDRPDATLARADRRQDLLLVGERILLGARRTEHEVEDALVERLARLTADAPVRMATAKTRIPAPDPEQVGKSEAEGAAI